MGSELGLATGLAFDVKVQATVVKRERISDHRWRTQMSYLLTNARSNPVTLDLVQRGLDWYWDDTRILTESRKSERLDSDGTRWRIEVPRSEEHTSELQSLMRISYAVFCLKKKNTKQRNKRQQNTRITH